MTADGTIDEPPRPRVETEHLAEVKFTVPDDWIGLQLMARAEELLGHSAVTGRTSARVTTGKGRWNGDSIGAILHEEASQSLKSDKVIVAESSWTVDGVRTFIHLATTLEPQVSVNFSGFQQWAVAGRATVVKGDLEAALVELTAAQDFNSAGESNSPADVQVPASRARRLWTWVNEKPVISTIVGGLVLLAVPALANVPPVNLPLNQTLAVLMVSLILVVLLANAVIHRILARKVGVEVSLCDSFKHAALYTFAVYGVVLSIQYVLQLWFR